MPQEQILTWVELNTKLRSRHLTMEQALEMFESEKAGANRKRWLKRIWSKYRALRTRREKKEMNLE